MRLSGTEYDDAMEEKIAAFKSDPQMMLEAKVFVNEVLEKAQQETARRKKSRGSSMVEHMEAEHVATRKAGRWHSRARGFLLRTLSAICLCNTTSGKMS